MEPDKLLDLESPDIFFSEEGLLKKEKADFQLRLQQKEMAEKVFEAFSKGKHLFAEAGTGTGKSYAYLYPGILQSIVNEERVVISTQTIALQEQVYLKDLPYLEKVLGITLKKAIAKGRGNYLCLRKAFIKRNEDIQTDDEKDFFTKIKIWTEKKTEGDREELSLTYKEKYLWLKVSSSSDDCFGSACQRYKDCYYFKQKRKIERSLIIVTNHSLLIRDIKMNNKLLPDYDYLVIDEGHNFSDEFINQYTSEFDFIKQAYFIDSLYRSRNSLLRRLEKNFSENIFYKDLSIYIENLKLSLPEFSENLRENGDLLKEQYSGFISEKRITEEYFQSEDFLEVSINIKALMKNLKKIGDLFLKITQVLEEEDLFEEIFLEIKMTNQQLTERILTLNDFIKPNFQKNVYWKKDASVFSAPLDVSEIINRTLFVLKRSIIVTSATLTVNKKFDFIIESFGLEKEEILFIEAGSPFNFKEQARCMILKDDLSLDETMKYIGKLSENFTGGSMILFTNHDFLRKTYYYLQDKYPERIILADGISGSRRNILKEFRESKNSILLGADSYWEGIDLEGDKLNNLVMTKLPFLPPNRPIVEATLEKISQSGGNNFFDYSVPKAVIKFRQGFGRLIRTESDKGNFYILDSRLISKNYGKIFINSIPEMDKYLLKVLE